MSSDRSCRSAIVLFAHGSREPDWALPFQRVRARLVASGVAAELAYLEIMQPSLDSACDDLVRDGAQRITIVPLFLAQGGHLKRDLPNMAEQIRRRHAGTEIVLLPPAGEAAEVIDAMANWVRRAVDDAADRKVKPADKPGSVVDDHSSGP
jgi:sirohydrochlorin cobaltochelatase